MIHNARFLVIVTLITAALAGAQLALASGEPQRKPQPTATTTATASSQAVRPGTGVVVPPTLRRISALTEEECEGLGGVVSTGGNDCATGELCQTSNRNGVIHQACITRK
jgi:uncharacterized membrane protein